MINGVEMKKKPFSARKPEGLRKVQEQRGGHQLLKRNNDLIKMGKPIFYSTRRRTAAPTVLPIPT